MALTTVLRTNVLHCDRVTFCCADWIIRQWEGVSFYTVKLSHGSRKNPLDFDDNTDHFVLGLRLMYHIISGKLSEG